MRTKGLIAALVIAALLVIGGCDSSNNVDISGIVQQNSGPLAGIRVEVKRNSEVIDAQNTDAGGHYTLQVPESSSPTTYRVEPVSGAYDFQPQYRDLQIGTSNQSGIDFFAIAKNIAPLGERLQDVINSLATNPNYLPSSSGTDYTPLAVSAAVYSPVHGLWHGVAGLQAPGGEPVTSDLLFGIGSITKTFIMALALTYCEDPNNPLDLTDTIGCSTGSGCDGDQIPGDQCWFSEEELPPEDIIPRNITIEELLFQTSGLRDSANGMQYMMYMLNNKPIADQIIKGHNTPSGGKDFVYCNLNYTIAGKILEKVIGPSSTVAQEINNLLGARSLSLPDTYMTYPDGFPADRRMVLGNGWMGFPSAMTGLPYDIPFDWRNENDPMIQQLLNNISDEEIVQIANYAGSMVSTAKDLANWAVALYKAREDGSSQILSAANRTLMLRNLQNYTYPPEHYGAGTFFYNSETVGHGGSNYIYLGLMQYHIPSGEAVVNLINRDDPLYINTSDSHVPNREAINQRLLFELHR